MHSRLTQMLNLLHFGENVIFMFIFRLLAAMMERRSIDGFVGKLQLVSADEIRQVYALESQSMAQLTRFV